MSFSLRTYLSVLSHRSALLFVLLCMLTFMASDPSGSRAYVPLWFSIVFWPILFTVYLGHYLLGLWVAASASNTFPRLRIPSPIVGLFALLPTIMLCKTAVQFMSGGTFPYNFEGQLVFYFVSIQALETVYYRFIFPELRKEIGAETAKRHLVVGGEKVDLDKLLHIEAREHHVHLTFDNAKSLARARLRDIVAQTKAEDGLQPHRSWWVARDPAIRAERKEGRLILRLRDDTEVPVARTRVDDVLNWLDDHIHPAQ